MRVEEARTGDVASVAEIRAGDTEAGPADARMERYLAGTHHPGHALRPRVMYLALQEDRIAGYIAGHLTTRFDCEGELQYLYVDRGCRRRGAASALLTALAKWFIEKGARRICVDVVPENAAARSLYRQHGAVELNRNWMVWEDFKVENESQAHRIQY